MHSSAAARSIARALRHHHEPFRIPALFARRQQRQGLHLANTSPTYHLLRKQQRHEPVPVPRTTQFTREQRRLNSDDAKPLTDGPAQSSQNLSQDADEIAARKAQEPAYEMTFTCRKCMTRSSHRITKQAYHFGTTLITCPGCKNRHLISDHLKIFSDKSITIEDILREKGEFITKGTLGEDGDVEFVDQKAIPEGTKIS